jgi:hypothetical protein
LAGGATLTGGAAVPGGGFVIEGGLFAACDSLATGGA